MTKDTKWRARPRQVISNIGGGFFMDDVVIHLWHEPELKEANISYDINDFCWLDIGGASAYGLARPPDEREWRPGVEKVYRRFWNTVEQGLTVANQATATSRRFLANTYETPQSRIKLEVVQVPSADGNGAATQLRFPHQVGHKRQLVGGGDSDSQSHDFICVWVKQGIVSARNKVKSSMQQPVLPMPRPHHEDMAPSVLTSR